MTGRKSSAELVLARRVARHFYRHLSDRFNACVFPPNTLAFSSYGERICTAHTVAKSCWIFRLLEVAQQ